ncbi:HAD-like domain-containing protein [Hygrophoropsis aurantiaca]|uniref:HAD-like domain-containing protein n=1 Tax=Hygrophoropsis aurantiaca TaxID=72124 RepID=A0ACB8AJQ9_9AGAM|nr:HAD-like domain-containing protein [Hygrophoropsis aurantiaca]
MMIRLVTFDALHTLVTPRLPIYIQYSQTFAPFIGDLDPNSIKQSFKVALKQVQQEMPVYKSDNGAQGWWAEVIKRTAIGAGADRTAVESSLPEMVPKLLHRFSSKEGYKLFDESIFVLRELHRMKIRTALISNTDARMRLALDDLDVSKYFNPMLLSEEVGIEKPDVEIFQRACQKTTYLDGNVADTVSPQEVVHVGDELVCDYNGAQSAGMEALLIRRPGPEGESERREDGENIQGLSVVNDLWGVVEWVKAHNSNASHGS